MLNFRKLKHDFAPAMLKDGKVLCDKRAVLSAKIVKMSTQSVRLSCRVEGNFENSYHCEIEVDRRESTTIDSDCDCPYKYDCHHLAAFLFYLEDHFEEMVVAYSKETNLEIEKNVDAAEKATLLETFREAESKEVVKRGKKNLKELLQEYVGAAQVLGQSPFFSPEEQLSVDKAELAIIFSLPPYPVLDNKYTNNLEIQLALRLPYRSKPLNIPNVREFFEAIRYAEALYIGSKRYFFTFSSFDTLSSQLLSKIMSSARFMEPKEERCLRCIQMDLEAFGMILAEAFDIIAQNPPTRKPSEDGEVELPYMPCFYCSSLEEPLRFSSLHGLLRFELEYLKAPAPKILLKPEILLESKATKPEEICFFECATPGMVHKNVYFRFQPHIKRKHLRNIAIIRDITIPEPLFGTFIENSLHELMRFAEVSNREIIDQLVTLPFVGKLVAECDIHYLDGELEAELSFIYDGICVPAASTKLSTDNVTAFVTKHGILARNLTEEQKIIADLFQDFIYDSVQGMYKVKNDKKIVEFMTDVIPRNQHRVKFNCPENLLDQFIYDDTTFILKLSETSRIDSYLVDLTVNGHLAGTTVDQLWECLSSRRSFIELTPKKQSKKKNAESNRNQKILVLDLDRLAPVVQVFEELGINKLDSHQEERPLWSLASIEKEQFNGLPIELEISDRLQEIQHQMLGVKPVVVHDIPSSIQATLRSYQIDGIGWLSRLRQMHLNGILADDMGLGKTLQAIIAITQHGDQQNDAISIIVCPTSLVHNWKEEFTKFIPTLKVLPVDGTPVQRKKLLNDIKQYNVVITSYSLLQKDIEIYKAIPFDYAILDEAQHIKNRATRNAKSVKMMQAKHRLILTGTPIENSLEELWSLFDFLMPGLLSSYDRFIEKYIRHPSQSKTASLEVLRRKVSPFILRRMKKDVVAELPPVSEIIYHCSLSDVQRELYHSYAQSAREELSQLVKKEGFDKVQIHVLATLTRLKQICCHPAIFAKDRPEVGDSAKYDMLLELLQSLIEGRHKTVIFSQYTRMLNIMREDLSQLGIRFEYLDGSSKNRMSIVKRFNEDPAISVFLVSLKAGGSGLNLTGADTVIHYDMWWNPAVENQATDRVHRIGQKNSVSAYKLVTLNSIEEKIVELQNRKKGIVKKIVSCDEEAIAKLTWEEVLELLQT